MGIQCTKCYLHQESYLQLKTTRENSIATKIKSELTSPESKVKKTVFCHKHVNLLEYSINTNCQL